MNWFSWGSDLAPGDQKSLGLDGASLRLVSVQQASQPEFLLGYEQLRREFGEKNELEMRSVLEKRLSWNPAGLRKNGFSLHYEMIWVESKGKFIAVRDHTAIVSATEAVVHLSHILVDPEWRRSGIAGWLRAWPVRWAREVMRGEAKPVTLVAEMEPLAVDHPERFPRLASIEKSGYSKVAGISYHQPDFRTPEIIDAEGIVRSLPMSLIIRSVGNESAKQVSGKRVRDWVSAIYTMYGEGIGESEMRSVWDQLRAYPAEDSQVELVLPTS